MREIQLGFISNKTTARLLNILEDIEKKRLFTLGEIAKKNNVSERTIASDIKYIKEFLEIVQNFLQVVRDLHLKRSICQNTKIKRKNS